jgi:hypothetical protein
MAKMRRAWCDGERVSAVCSPVKGNGEAFPYKKKLVNTSPGREKHGKTTNSVKKQGLTSRVELVGP